MTDIYALVESICIVISQKPGEKCIYGGGLWNIDEGRGAIILYGRSFDFGPPDFDYVKVIEWGVLGGKPHPLFHQPTTNRVQSSSLELPRCEGGRRSQPHWPNDDTLIPVYAKP